MFFFNTMPRLAVIAALALLGACTQTGSYGVTDSAPISNPPPVPPGPNATWYHVSFATDSFAIDSNGQAVVNTVIA
jgi:hypothetical protein